ncbi:MAG: signal peptidase I [Dethiobacteria bacterium]|nr:signal peptidase I [Dethiobacteria bacterium]
MSSNKNLAVAISWLKQLILILLLTFLVSVFIVQTYDISDVSMEPTFDRQGNRVLVLLTPYHFGSIPGYDDLVIIDSRVNRPRTLWDKVIESPLVALFVREERQYMWVKRVIGLPGDTLEYGDGRVYRNGTQLDEPYSIGKIDNSFAPVIVPQGHIFVMGDNRNHSSDSREIGPVPIVNIQGRVLVRVFPLDKINTY